MYIYEDFENVLLKFNELIKKDLKVKEKELLDISKELEIIKFKEDFSKYFSIEFIINNKDKIIQIIPEMTNDINIIEFFYNNNAINVEQVSICLNNIKQNSFFSRNISFDELILRKEQIEKEINIYNKILNNEEYSLDEYIETVESSPLNQKEKLLIYSNMAYKSIKQEEKIVQNDEVIKNEDNITYNDCREEYVLYKEKVQNFISKYYGLINGKDIKYINYIKSYVNTTKSNGEDFTYDYLEEKLLIKIFELIELKEEIEKEIKNLNNNSSKEELENLQLNIEILKEELETIELYSNKYEGYKKEELSNEMSNKIYYLIDEKGNLFFDVTDFDNEQKQKIPALIDKLNRGMYDYQKGVKHTKVQTTYKDNNVFVNKISDMAVTFIRIDDEKVLVLNIDTAKNIFNSIQTILSTKSSFINKTIANIINSNKEELDKQDSIILELNSKFKNGGNPKL